MALTAYAPQRIHKYSLDIVMCLYAYTDTYTHKRALSHGTTHILAMFNSSCSMKEYTTVTYSLRNVYFGKLALKMMLENVIMTDNHSAN